MDLLTEILTLVLHNPTPNALQDASTFIRLLCVNQQLSRQLLSAAQGRLTLSWPSSALQDRDQYSMIAWFQRHVLHHQTLKQLDLLADLSAVELQDYEEHGVGYMMLQPANRNGAFCDRVACVLGAAAVFGGLQLPALQGWCSRGLPPATLSLLPGGQLTQLVLTATDLDPLTAQELAGITSLRDLRLPLLNPARRELAPVLASLTRLTRLLLCNPAARVLDSLPASMLVLELVRWHQTTLQLGHLTALQTLQLAGWDSLGNMNQKLLQLAGVAQAYDGDMGPIFNDSDSDGPDDPEEPPMPSGGELDSAAALPTQLQRLLAIGILDAAPLAQVSGLVHLQLTGLPDSYQEALPGLRALTQLTRVELLQRFWSATIVDAASWGPLFQGLPLHVPRLRLQVPVSYPLTVNPARLVRALHPITSLTRLDLSRGRAPRAAAILAAAAAAGGNGVGDGTWQATVDQLASLLPASLVELKLSRLPAVAAESGVAAVGAEWLPLMERIARLPALRSLHVKSMPLGRSIAPLGDARHLTSLALVYCAVDDGDFATAFGPGRAGPVVLQSLKVETIPGDWSGEPKLSAAGMLAGLAGAHMLQHLQVLQLPGHGLTKGQLWPLVSSLPLLTKLEL